MASEKQRAAWAVSKARLTVGTAHRWILEPQSTAATGYCVTCGATRFFDGGDGRASMFTQPTVYKPKPDLLPLEGVNTW